jgi:hypothetical protein
MHATTATSAERAPRWQAILQRWPSALGLAVASLQLAGDPDTETVATVLAVAVLCYLAAAALARRWVAWAGCVLVSGVLVASQQVGLTWWAVGGVVALGLVMVGLLGEVPRGPWPRRPGRGSGTAASGWRRWRWRRGLGWWWRGWCWWARAGGTWSTTGAT